MRRFPIFALTCVAIAAASSPSRAGDGADPGVQATITAQIDAFNRGDAAAAESYAAADIRAMFPDPANFYGMVRHSYGALIHPRSTRFEPTVTAGGSTIQHVTVVDADGVVWTAVYTLEKVGDRWAISGCVLVRSSEVTA